MVLSDVMAEINGVLYTMTQTSEGVWSVEDLDLSEDGGYVCAFWATDDAGNTAYRTAVLWVVDGKPVCLRFIETPFSVTEISSDLSTMHIGSDLVAFHVGSCISATHVESDYIVHYKGVCCT